jgi:hypothetical protein
MVGNRCHVKTSEKEVVAETKMMTSAKVIRWQKVGVAL